MADASSSSSSRLLSSLSRFNISLSGFNSKDTLSSFCQVQAMADEDRRFCRHISEVVQHGCAFVGVNLEYCRGDDVEDAGDADAEGADDRDADADDE